MAVDDKQASRGLSRREILKYGTYTSLLAALSPSLWLSGCGRKKTSVKQTNVILISIDTLRADHVGCYGYQRPTSPTLDNLASEGLLFEDVTSTSPWTLPAHGSLLTGLYPNRHGLKSYNNRLPNDVVTLSEILSKHGFSTAAVVNSLYVSQRYGFNRGFDYFTYVKEIINLRVPSRVGDEALNWLAKYCSEPFFLFLHYFDIHSDYTSLPRYEKQFIRPYHGVADGTTAQLIYFRRGQVHLDQTDAVHLVDLYDASIRQMDDGIARLLRFLETRKLLDNSLIVITSDHGEEFLDHGGVLHSRTQYQELLHVPIIMWGPGVPSSKRLKNVVSLVDVMPTVLSLLDIPKPSSLDGFDLSPLWQQSASQLPPRYLFAEASKDRIIPDERNIKHDIKRAVRHPRYKLHYDRLTKKIQMYDLRNDPSEKIDVASQHASLVDSMFSQLESFMTISKIGPSIPPLSPEEVQMLKSLGYL
ncbi:MAG: sulfatase [Planctomycetota bacterium]|nr:MAG: sulfatase [Planctomycetota bacterium]